MSAATNPSPVRCWECKGCGENLWGHSCGYCQGTGQRITWSGTAPDVRPEEDPGDYYQNKAAMAKFYRREIKAAKEQGADDKTIAALERKLEMALYVGD